MKRYQTYTIIYKWMAILLPTRYGLSSQTHGMYCVCGVGRNALFAYTGRNASRCRLSKPTLNDSDEISHCVYNTLVMHH